MAFSLEPNNKKFMKRKPAWLRPHGKRRETRAEYLKAMNALCGSITDETFVRPPQVMTLENHVQ